MVERSERLPHIQLSLTTEGSASSPRGGGRQNQITLANAGNRQGHGRKLKGSLDSLIFDWRNTEDQREEEGKPPLPEKAVPIILQVDPVVFDAEDLRTYGIEVIAELEDGYIIGASVEDDDFSELQKKIELFIQEKRGGGNVAGIWEILDGSRRPEYILSPELLNSWDSIQDGQIYLVDVGIACVGSKS